MSSELRDSIRSEVDNEVEVLDGDEENDPQHLINAFDKELEQLQQDMEFKERMGETLNQMSGDTQGEEDDQL